MTVENTTAVAGPYLANGSTTDFPFSFEVGSDAEIRVASVDDDLAELELYSLADYQVLLEDTGGGTVRFFTAPDSGVSLLLTPDPLFTQELDFVDNGPWQPERVGEGFDRAAARDIWLKDRVGRALLGPPGSSFDPLPADLAGKMLMFDADGQPVAVDPLVIQKVVAAQANDGETYYARLIEGVIDGTALDVAAAEEAMLAIQALGGGILKLPVGVIIPDADDIDIPDNVEVHGCGRRTRVQRRAVPVDDFADTGIFRVTGDGPRAWRVVSDDLEEGAVEITGIVGDISDVDADVELAIRSTEFGEPHIYDRVYQLWTAGATYTTGTIVGFVNARAAKTIWAVARVGGVAGGAQPVITEGSFADVVDGGVTWVWTNITDKTEQNLWTSGGIVLGAGRIVVAPDTGYIYVTLNAGAFSAVAPAQFTNDFTNGSVHLAYAGYYNARKGEIIRAGEVWEVDGDTIKLTRGLRMAYVQDYPSGASFTVEVSVLDRSAVKIANMTVEGSGLPDLTGASFDPRGRGTYETSTQADKGLLAQYAIVETEGIRWKNVNQFTIHLVNSDLTDVGSECRHNAVQLESQQYYVFQQGAGMTTMERPVFVNSRHGWDGDGGSRSFGWGIPDGITVTGGRCAGVWQTPFSGHRDCGPVRVVNFHGRVLAEAIKNRQPDAQYSNCTFWCDSRDFENPAIALYYFGGRLKLSNVKIYNPYVGLGCLSFDTPDACADIEGDVEIINATNYSVRFGGQAGDGVRRVSLKVVSRQADPARDHVLLDGPCEQITFTSLDLTGGRHGLTNSNRRIYVDGLVVGPVNMRGLSGCPYLLYNLTEGCSLEGGSLETSEDNVACDFYDCQGVRVGGHNLTLTATGFTGNGWRFRSTDPADSQWLSVEDQLVVVEDDAGGAGMVVEADVRNSHFGFVTSNATTPIDKQATDPSVTYDNP